MEHITAPVMESVLRKDPGEKEFHQAVHEVLLSLSKVIDSYPNMVYHKILDRIVEPERVISFRVPWTDDQGILQINRGCRVEMNSALGPYKGGIRFHPSVNLSIMKFLAFEQTFKNALTGLNLGGGKGGADFDPKGKSDLEIMRFCQSFMSELWRHIGESTDIPAGDIGVGGREIGYMFGQYKRLRNEFSGVLTGKGSQWGGSFLRPEATGFGLVYFAAHMLAGRSETLEGKTCLISGSGNVAQFTAEKLLEMGAKVISFSDSTGAMVDHDGIDHEKLAFVKQLKNVHRGRIAEYQERYPHAQYYRFNPRDAFSPLWAQEADCAFPCATQNEINEQDAKHLAENKVILTAEGANMPTSEEGIEIFLSSGMLFGPAKAANAGGVAVSGLEMAQNGSRLQWSRSQVDDHLHRIMKNIYTTCVEYAQRYSTPENFVDGANIAGFIRTANAMLDQGYV